MARNPNGKRGSQRHRDVQEAELEKAKTEFPDDRVDTEVTISTPNGKKKSRVADVAAFSKDKPLRFSK